MSSAFLEYGVEVAGRREIYGARSGLEADDSWYLYHYLDEILQLRSIGRAGPTKLEQLPRKEKYFLLHALIKATSATRIAELGSSLFEIIDGLEAVQALFCPGQAPDARQYAYLGIERSEFLAEVSRLLHQNHEINLHASVESMLQYAERWGGVIYDRIVSSLAFNDSESLAHFLDQFDAGILNLLASREETFTSQFFGAQYTYFSLREVQRHLKRPLFHLFGFRAPKHAELRATGRSVIEGFFFYGGQDTLKDFTDYCRRCEPIWRFWVSKQINPQPISTFI
jgi:hypothetical protein